MGLADFLRRLSRELKRAGVPFVLVGGFAVNAYGFSRATGDIDFLMTEEDFEKALPLLEAIGVKLLQRQHLYATLKHEAVLMKVDILFTDKKTMEEILKETKETTVKGEKFLIPSLERLNLPVFDGPTPPPPVLSMDQYVEFVEFYVKELLNWKAYEDLVRRTRVNVPFRLK